MDPDLAFLLSGAAPAADAVQGVQPPVQTAQQAAVSGVQGAATPPAATPDAAPAAAPAPAGNEVKGLTVTAAPSYDNKSAANSVLRAMAAEPDAPGAPPGKAHGIWGLLPQNMQHGTLRDSLGMLGDMFLMGSGRNMQYTPHLQQQQNAIALAGYGQPSNGGQVPTGETDKDGQPVMRAMTPEERQASIYSNSQKAIERMMATGNPGTGQQGIQMEENLNNANIHRDQLTMMNQYRQQQIEARNQANLQRMTPYIGGLAGQAKDAAGYQKVHDQAEAMAQRIGPDYHASDLGLPDPKDWTPGMSLGVTGGQTLHAQTSEDSIAERGGAAAQAHQDRMYHYQHPNFAPRQPTAATLDAGIINKLNQGIPLSPGEQQYWNRRQNGTRGGARPLLTTGGNPVQAPQHIQPSSSPPPANEANYFRQHPQFKAQFEARYGQGSWNKYIGK